MSVPNGLRDVPNRDGGRRARFLQNEKKAKWLQDQNNSNHKSKKKFVIMLHICLVSKTDAVDNPPNHISPFSHDNEFGTSRQTAKLESFSARCWAASPTLRHLS